MLRAMSARLPPPPEDLDPEYFAELGANFMSAKLLGVAVDLGIFEKLGDGPLTLDELQQATNLPRRALRVVANGLAALGVVDKIGERYCNGELAQAFLAGKTNIDVRAGLKLYNHIIYPLWMGLENTVRTGNPSRPPASSEAFAKIFSEGVEAWTAPGARALPEKIDFAEHRRVLDIGGGTGSYLVPLLERYPMLRATLLDLPPSIAHARRRLAREAVRDRIELLEADAFIDPLPDGHDVVLVAGFIHLFNPDKALVVLKRVREHVQPGARLIIVDQWMDATHTRPLFGAMLAVTYLLLSGEGDTYSVDEAKPWLDASGWRFAAHEALAGVTSAVVAVAV
jgi:ubiquinone/menaquinone biosynthesis C-methylase UbiE